MQGPLETFSPPGSSKRARSTVGVRCRAGQNWSIYVPVTIEITKPILIANRQLPRDTIIGSGDFRVEEHPVSQLHRGYLQDPHRVIGKILNRDIREGDVLTPGWLEAATTVKKGSMVTILARTGTVQVRMEGTALADGATGEKIKVQNSSSNRQLEATVTSSGTVEVNL